MRQDLSKIIYDGHTPRAWGPVLEAKKARRFKVSEDLEVVDNFSRSKVSSKNSKELNINYKVVRKILFSYVGTPWSEVYSKLRKIITKPHVLEYVFDCIRGLSTEKVIIKEGRAYSAISSKFYSDREINDLYVHPITKILSYQEDKYDKREFLKRRKAWIAESYREIQGKFYIKEKGIWYKIPSPLKNVDYFAYSSRNFPEHTYMEVRRIISKRDNLRGIFYEPDYPSKKQLSTFELKKLGFKPQ